MNPLLDSLKKKRIRNKFVSTSKTIDNNNTDTQIYSMYKQYIAKDI